MHAVFNLKIGNMNICARTSRINQMHEKVHVRPLSAGRSKGGKPPRDVEKGGYGAGAEPAPEQVHRGAAGPFLDEEQGDAASA